MMGLDYEYDAVNRKIKAREARFRGTILNNVGGIIKTCHIQIDVIVSIHKLILNINDEVSSVTFDVAQNTENIFRNKYI